MKRYISILLFISILIAFGSLFIGCYSGNNNGEESNDSLSVVRVEDSDTIDLPPSNIDNPISLIPSNPMYDKETDSYSLAVNADNVPNGVILEYYIRDAFDENKVIATSKDGKFSGIKASTTDGNTYMVGVKQDGRRMMVAERNVAGFVPVVTVAKDKKMTMADIQKLIESESTSLYSDPNFSPNLSFKVTNLASGDSCPKDFSELLSKLKMEIWKSVSVSAIDFDENNRVNSITLKVVYDE